MDAALSLGAVERELSQALGTAMRFDEGHRAVYTSDASLYRQVPIDVVVPKALDDFVKGIEICRRHNATVLMRGGGTSMRGRLRAMLAGIIDMPILIRSHFISTLKDKVQSLQHHRDLAAAVRAGDAELARQVMTLHLRVASHRFKQQRSELGGARRAGEVS